jgi:hypothetical protein
MTRRAHRLILALPVAVVLVLAVAWLLWPRTAITRENADKIQNGMRLAEVEELLGGPARNESDMPNNFIRDAFINPGPPPFQHKRWASPALVVFVDFDESGRVTRHSHFAFNEDRSLVDRLRRWLGLLPFAIRQRASPGTPAGCPGS